VSTSKIRPNGNFVPLVFFGRLIFHSWENTGAVRMAVGLCLPGEAPRKDASHSAGGGPHGPLGTCRDLAHGGRRLSGMGDREPSPGGDADIAARQQLLPGHHRLQDSLVLVLKQPVVHPGKPKHPTPGSWRSYKSWFI
jgi:hypothetical protein